MPREPIELLPEDARVFLRDMKAYFAAKDSLKPSRTATIAQLRALFRNDIVIGPAR